MADQKISDAQWVMKYLRGVEQTGEHAPTETMQKVMDECAALRKDLRTALCMIANEYPNYDDRYKDAVAMAERHNLGDIDPN
jgi:hypothetical protein